MTIKAIIQKTLTAKGNHTRGNEDTYIAPSNMETFVEDIGNCSDFTSILITPYLFNTEDDALYELHYYEFELEIRDVPQSYYAEYQEGNILADEIVNNIKPKAIIAKNDKVFLVKSLQNYLKNMESMVFAQDRKINKSLENADLFYQIF